MGRTLLGTGDCQLPEMEASLRALESAWLGFQTTGVRAYHARTNNGYVAESTCVRPITLDLPTHVLNPEPISPPSSQASPQSAQPQTGEHADELTPNTILVQPIADLALPEDLSDSEIVVTVVPAQRRASVALEDASNPGTSDDATKNRARRSSAQ